MRIYGFSDVDWEPLGYAYGLPDGFRPFPAVEPQILNRPGTFPTFGPANIQALTITGSFIILPTNAIGSGENTIDEQWAYLFQRLNPYNQIPRQLRGQSNDGTRKFSTLAVMRVLPFNDDQQNVCEVHFITTQPFWPAQSSVSLSAVTL